MFLLSFGTIAVEFDAVTRPGQAFAFQVAPELVFVWRDREGCGAALVMRSLGDVSGSERASVRASEGRGGCLRVVLCAGSIG